MIIFKYSLIGLAEIYFLGTNRLDYKQTGALLEYHQLEVQRLLLLRKIFTLHVTDKICPFSKFESVVG